MNYYMKIITSLVPLVALFSSLSMAAEYSFIEQGKALAVQQDGKYEGRMSSIEGQLNYKLGATGCQLIGSRKLEGGAYQISASFSGIGHYRFFVGAVYKQSWAASYRDYIEIKDGKLVGKGGFSFKAEDTPEQIELTVQSDGKKVSLKLNGKVVAETSKADVLNGGFFGFQPMNRESEVNIITFNLESAKSSLVAPQPLRPRNRSNEKHWSKVHDQACNAEACDLLMLGDSITDAFDGDATFVKNPDQSGLAVIEKSFSELKIVNAGIGSDRSQNLLWRIERMPLEKLQPKVITLMIGINNISSGNKPQVIAEGIEGIVKHLSKRLPQTKILLIATLPTRKADLNKARQELHDLVISKEWQKNVKVIDLDATMKDDKGLLKKEATFDGVHLTAMGFQMWADAIASDLKMDEK